VRDMAEEKCFSESVESVFGYTRITVSSLLTLFIVTLSRIICRNNNDAPLVIVASKVE
jgi:hypothetical protein